MATENRRRAILIPLWGLAITATYAQAIYQRAYLTIFDYLIVLSICALAGAITMDIGKALINFLGAIAIGVIILFVLVALPASSGGLPSPADVIFSSIWVTVIFTYVFPLPFIGFLMASIIGGGLGERYL